MSYTCGDFVVVVNRGTEGRDVVASELVLPTVRENDAKI